MSSISLNTIILISAVAFLTGIARLMLEVRFVTEIVEAMPEDNPAQAALVMLPFVLLFSGWLGALLSATRNRRRGLIGLIVFNLILALAWGLGTVVAFCPTPCWVAPPLTDIVTWANVIVGLIAAAMTGIYLRRAT